MLPSFERNFPLQDGTIPFQDGTIPFQERKYYPSGRNVSTGPECALRPGRKLHSCLAGARAPARPDGTERGGQRGYPGPPGVAGHRPKMVTFYKGMAAPTPGGQIPRFPDSFVIWPGDPGDS